jgi:hypothetical protein
MHLKRLCFCYERVRALEGAAINHDAQVTPLTDPVTGQSSRQPFRVQGSVRPSRQPFRVQGFDRPMSRSMKALDTAAKKDFPDAYLVAVWRG